VRFFRRGLTLVDALALVEHGAAPLRLTNLTLVSRFAQQTRLVVPEGSRDALVAKFLDAAAIQRDNPDCEVMFVSESPVDDTTVYLTEIWTSEKAWARATRSSEISAWAEGMSTLVAGEPESIRLVPIGGKGVPERSR
jgi:quinol monooxygenase YgiN